MCIVWVIYMCNYTNKTVTKDKCICKLELIVWKNSIVIGVHYLSQKTYFVVNIKFMVNSC